MPRPFVLDRWAPLSHKTLVGDGIRRPGVASWVPPEDARRLATYMLLAAMRSNVSRYYLPDHFGEEQVAKYREYGHAGRLVIAAHTSLLGDEQTLAAPALGDDIPDDQQPTAEQTAAIKALEWLRRWARKERLWLKMALAELDAVALGDGVYVLGWNAAKQRPKLRQYDPGFYFPDLRNADDDDEFPSTIHLAWEQTGPTNRPELHRMTWRLGLIRPAQDPDAGYGERLYLYDDQGRPVPQPGDTVDAEGYLVRTYAWDPKPSRETCHFSYGVWDLAKVKSDVLDLSTDGARWQRNADGDLEFERDLRLDFIPVLHEPNTPAGAEHFGESIISLVSQLLDDLAMTDTDLAESGALAGSATLVTKGATPGDLQAGPGSRIDLPQTASAQYLDTSKNLDALLKLSDALKDTLSENSRISNVSLGRVDAANAVSGLALALSFSPEEGLVRQLRSVRDEKFPLLLKMAMRMAQGAKILDAGPTPEIVVQLGSFKPADQAQAVEHVAAAMQAGAMSTRTAVLHLQQAGFPIEDAEKEVGRIKGESFAKAVQLLEALGDEAAVYAFLGINPPKTVAVPPET